MAKVQKVGREVPVNASVERKGPKGSQWILWDLVQPEGFLVVQGGPNVDKAHFTMAILQIDLANHYKLPYIRDPPASTIFKVEILYACAAKKSQKVKNPKLLFFSRFSGGGRWWWSRRPQQRSRCGDPQPLPLALSAGAQPCHGVQGSEGQGVVGEGWTACGRWPQIQKLPAKRVKFGIDPYYHCIILYLSWGYLFFFMIVTMGFYDST